MNRRRFDETNEKNLETPEKKGLRVDIAQNLRSLREPPVGLERTNELI